MTNRFVDLNRKFNRVPNREGDDNDISDFSELTGTGGKAWDQLCELSRVIILAEAGAGKTEEIRNQASKLKSTGKHSFFLRLEDISCDFRAAFELDAGDEEDFDFWLASDEKAYFFLDSVDEAKLKNERDFNSAIRALRKALSGCLDRAHLYITSRASAWRTKTDLSFVNRELCEQPRSKSSDELNEQFSVYSLNNLSTDEIKRFSDEFGVVDTEKFISQLREKEVEEFANRPLDLIDLIDYWKDHGQVGSRLEVVESSIVNKLKIEDVGRDLADVSYGKISAGAEEIAAAMVFCKQSNVSSYGTRAVNDVLEVEQILNEWEKGEVETLLSRPIFEPSRYGSLRYPNRLIREYLAAKWIYKRVQNKAISQSELHGFFYKNVYGLDVLAPSMKPILAWYSLLDNSIEDLVIDRSPEVFIGEGDSSQLHIDTRKKLISRFCELYSNKEQCYITFDWAAIKRFSNPEMGELINRLLNDYYQYKDLRQILLQIAESSSMKECFDTVVRMSLDTNIDPVSLSLVIRIIKANSNPEFISSHALSVLDIVPKESDRLFTVVVSELGHDLPIALLLESFTSLDMSERRGFRDINYYIEKFAEELDLESAITALNFIYPLIDEKPYMNQFRCDISEKYEWLIPVAQRLVLTIIDRKREGDICYELLASLSKISTYDKTSYHSDEKINDKLRGLVNSWKPLSNALFWYEVESSRARLKREEEKTGTSRPLNRWFQAGSYYRFWAFEYRDLDTVLSWVDSKELDDDKFVALTLAWELIKGAGFSDENQELLDSVASNLEGAPELISNFRNPTKEDWEIEYEERNRKYIEDRAREEEESKKNAEDWVIHLQENLHFIDSLELAEEGNTNRAQTHLYIRLRNHAIDNHSYIVDDCSPLIEEFGEEITSRFSNFLVNYWKYFEDNILLSEGSKRNSTTYATIMALCGIEIENKTNPNWVDGISAEQAIKATRLSLCELNRIPSWMEKVYKKYPNEALGVYLSGLKWCYEDESENDNSSFVLDKVISSCSYLHNDIARPIYDLLTEKTISSYHLLKQSVRLLSVSDLKNEQLAELAICKLDSEKDNILIYIWWALYIATKPNDILSVFEKKLAELPEEEATDLAINVLNFLIDKRGFGALTNRQEYINVPNLVSLYKIMHKYIREEDDIIRAGGGVYSPTARDDAQDARNAIFSSIKNIPGEESYYALIRIARMWSDMPWRESWIEHLALERAATDGDSKSMSEKEFSEFSGEKSKIEKPTMIIGNVTNSTVVQNTGEITNRDISNSSQDNAVAMNGPDSNIGVTKGEPSNSNLKTIILGIVVTVIGGLILYGITEFL